VAAQIKFLAKPADTPLAPLREGNRKRVDNLDASAVRGWCNYFNILIIVANFLSNLVFFGACPNKTNSSNVNFGIMRTPLTFLSLFGLILICSCSTPKHLNGLQDPQVTGSLSHVKTVLIYGPRSVGAIEQYPPGVKDWYAGDIISDDLKSLGIKVIYNENEPHDMAIFLALSSSQGVAPYGHNASDINRGFYLFGGSIKIELKDLGVVFIKKIYGKSWGDFGPPVYYQQTETSRKAYRKLDYNYGSFSEAASAFKEQMLASGLMQFIEILKANKSK